MKKILIYILENFWTTLGFAILAIANVLLLTLAICFTICCAKADIKKHDSVGIVLGAEFSWIFFVVTFFIGTVCMIGFFGWEKNIANAWKKLDLYNRISSWRDQAISKLRQTTAEKNIQKKQKTKDKIEKLKNEL